jgi:hypothetical protein
MNNKKHFLKTNQAGFVTGAVLLAVLIIGVGRADAQNSGVIVTPPVVVAPVVTTDNYVYYPNYGVYYNNHRHQYHFLKGDVWMAQPAPAGVPVDVLMASPSVNMDFHDSPEKHHAEMLKKYPHNWKPSAEHQDRKEERKDAGPNHDKK